MSPRANVGGAHDTVFGNNIRELRIRQGMTEGALGAEIGVNQQQISKYEKGIASFPVSRLQALCGALGVSPRELLRDILDASEFKRESPQSNDLWASRTATRLNQLPLRHRRTVLRLINALSELDSTESNEDQR